MNYPPIILGMMIVTFGTRYLVMMYFSKVEIPHRLKSALNFVPPVILTSIIVPTLLLTKGKFNFSISNLPLIAGILTSVIAIKTKSLLTTIIAGMLILWGLKFFTSLIS